MTIKISSDSTCDLSQQLLRDYDIDILPLYVTKDGESFKDGVSISQADLLAYTAATGKLCSTAAVSAYDYGEAFRVTSANYDAVIHITLSSEMSSCYQNACAAASEFKNVYIVDSRNLSTGHGLVVLEAARLARRGDLTAEEIVAQLNELTGKVEASFLLDRLDYMAKGGRCSSVAALGANLLRLKPCIEVVDGKMRVVKKYRGAYAKCIRDYVTERLSGRDDLRGDTLFITHSPTDRDIIDAAQAAAAECSSFEEVFETDAGSTITCHCGPNTLGVLFIRK